MHNKRNLLSKNTAYILIMIIAVMPLLTMLTACSNELASPIGVTGYKLNTYVSIDAYTTGGHSSKELNNILEEALSLCDKYELMFSRTNPQSTLYKVNSKEITNIPSELGYLIKTGLSYCEISEGAFDITIGSVSSLWDFSGLSDEVPDSKDIENALKYVDYTKVDLSENNDGSYNISMPDGMMLDLGAIAKGYIADKIKEFLLSKNIENAIINLGGNVLCVGQKKENVNFNIALKKPFGEASQILTTLSINDKSVVSSGTYERYFSKDDVLYHHILNPKTGYPYNNDIDGVTIISDSSLIGDCLSTVCFVLGSEKGLELISDITDTEAMYVSGSDLYYSDNFKNYINK